METYAFICGVARSGTSALTRLLNNHKDVAIGMERYISFANPEQIACLNRQAFLPENFGTFSTHQTHFLPEVKPAAQTYYALVLSKYNVAKVVGDKVPRYYRFCDHLLHEFKPCKIVFISRAICEVAHSWNARARNPEELHWNAQRDYRAAVNEWNCAHATILKHVQKRPDAFYVVDYHDLFFDGGNALAKLCGFLGVPPDDHALVSCYHGTADEASQIRAKSRDFTAEEMDFIEGEADGETRSRLLKLYAGRS